MSVNGFDRAQAIYDAQEEPHDEPIGTCAECDGDLFADDVDEDGTVICPTCDDVEEDDDE